MPLVANWPSVIPEGIVCKEPASLMDLLPTFLRLAGVEFTDDRAIDGIDIWPAFIGQPVPDREALYYYFQYSLNAIRVGRWKLHVARGNKGDVKEMPQLFDMDINPQENYNLADRHPDIVEKLREMIESFDAEVKAERESHEL